VEVTLVPVMIVVVVMVVIRGSSSSSSRIVLVAAAWNKVWNVGGSGHYLLLLLLLLLLLQYYYYNTTNNTWYWFNNPTFPVLLQVRQMGPAKNNTSQTLKCIMYFTVTNRIHGCQHILRYNVMTCWRQNYTGKIKMGLRFDVLISVATMMPQSWTFTDLLAVLQVKSVGFKKSN